VTRPTLLVLAVVGMAALVSAQPPGSIEFGREPGVRRGGEKSEDQTQFRGRADGLKMAGSVNTYRGNVTISFPDAKITLRADEVIYDDETNEMSLAGNVRLKLDVK
jgi:lipopolysaccharide assembly outer membrane protein LptD (OstA)